MIALGAMAVLACNQEVAGPDSVPGPGPIDGPGQRVGAVVLQVEADTLWVNETAQLIVTVLGMERDTLTDAAVTFVSSNEHVLNVSSTGLVTAVGPGTAAITARAENTSATARLFAAAASMGPVSEESQTGDIGKPLGEQFVVRVTDALGEGVAGLRVVWSVKSGEGAFLPSNGANEAVTFTRGTFSILDKVITFDFGANERAIGTLRGDSLSVKYNLEAAIDGFEDGVYVRSPQKG